MGKSKSIDQLHEKYQKLEQIPLDRRSDDLIRSLCYYRAATQQGTATVRIQRWIDKAALLEEFVAEHFRMPHENSRKRATKSKLERSLADWVRYQRRIEERLSDYQARRLEQIEGFSWDPRRRN